MGRLTRRGLSTISRWRRHKIKHNVFEIPRWLWWAMLGLGRPPLSTSWHEKSLANRLNPPCQFHTPRTISRGTMMQVMTTLGVDYSAKNLPGPGQTSIRLNLWDVAGVGQLLQFLWLDETQAKSVTEFSLELTFAAARFTWMNIAPSWRPIYLYVRQLLWFLTWPGLKLFSRSSWSVLAAW